MLYNDVNHEQYNPMLVISLRLLCSGLVTMRLWVAAVLLPDWLPDTGHW